MTDPDVEMSTDFDERYARDLNEWINASARRHAASRSRRRTAALLEAPAKANSNKAPKVFSAAHRSSTASSDSLTTVFQVSDSELSSLEDDEPQTMTGTLIHESCKVADAFEAPLDANLDMADSRYQNTSRNPTGLEQKTPSLTNCTKMKIIIRIGGNGSGINCEIASGEAIVTVTAANLLSDPPPGPELLATVQGYQKAGLLPKSIHPSVIRYVRGKWLVPEKCKKCFSLSRHRKHVLCDRREVCSSCCRHGTECAPATTMVQLSCRQRYPVMDSSLHSISQLILCPLSAAQHPDSTWRVANSQHEQFDPTKKRKAEQFLEDRKPSSGTVTENGSVVSPLFSQSSEPIEHSHSGTIIERTAAAPRRPKDSDEFAKGSKKRRVAKKGIIVGASASVCCMQSHSPTTTSVSTVEAPSTKSKLRKGSKIDTDLVEQNLKPQPRAAPPVWAEKRQQLCEALPYYRAFQSGAYTDNRIARGFMCDQEVGPRDIFTGEIIIARVGGGRTLDPDTGEMVQSKDQDRSTTALSFERSKLLQQPVAMIIGNRNRLSPTRMPHRYNVLDWFHVTDVWCEKYNGLRCWMVRLEKIDLTSISWWMPTSYCPPDPDRGFEEKIALHNCPSCNAISRVIYDAGPACLQTSCLNFFDFGTPVDHEILCYNRTFLNMRTQYRATNKELLEPRIVTDEDLDVVGAIGVEQVCKAGIVCPDCKGCTRRVEWSQWKCEHGCGFIHKPRQRVAPIAAILSNASGERRSSQVKHELGSGIRYSQTTIGLYDVYEYSLPSEDKDVPAGFIRHFKSCEVMNAQEGGPDDLFEAMQRDDFGLKRHAARQPGASGEILTSHWAANWGAPYKYGVAVASRGFDEAPDFILKALKRLTWAGNQTFTNSREAFSPFNELLSIGYMENAAIGFHDDGEKTLGPTVATLSLGVSAKMMFRPKKNTNFGGASKNAKGTKANVLTICLDHGDIIIMHGTGVQKMYEHAVKPIGLLRFALTCRNILPELLDSDEERQIAAVKGALPVGHERFDYHGDTHCCSIAPRSARYESQQTSQLLAYLRAALDCGALSRAQRQELQQMLAESNCGSL